MKVFVAGPRAIKKLDAIVETRLDNMIQKQAVEFLIGDAAGVDKIVQQYLLEKECKEVTIYASDGKARNNVGAWNIKKVTVEGKKSGFDFYAAKDIQMAEDADYGFMIWNGESKGTLNNILNLINRSKKVLVFFTPHHQFYCIETMENAEQLLSVCDLKTKQLFDEMSFSKSVWKSNEQLRLEMEYTS